MIDSYYRTPYQTICVDPFVVFLARRNLHPIHLTLAALVFGMIIIPLLMYGFVWTAIASLLTSGYLDTLDGSLARLRNQTSQTGAALDILTDRIVEFSVVLGLFFVDPPHRGLLCLLMLGSILTCVTSFLVVGIFTANDSEKSFHYSPGIMERAEAFLFFLLMIALPSLFPFLAITFTLLVFTTAAIRMKEFIRSP